MTEFYELDAGPADDGARETQPAHTLPHDLEAERAVLGGVLLDNGALALIDPIVAAADFYHPGHGLIFEAIKSLAARKEPVDVVTLAAELRTRDRINTIGGQQYLGELTDNIPTIAHIEHHARIVADLAALRATCRKAEELAARIHAGSITLSEAAALAGQAVRATERTTEVGPSSLMDVCGEMYDALEAQLNGTAKDSSLPTGLVDLDALTAGVYGLTVIGGYSSHGKTSLATQIALHNARRGKPVLFFSLEMPRADFVRDRLAGPEAGIDALVLRHRAMSADQWTALQRAVNGLAQLPVWIDGKARNTAEIRARVIRQKSECDLSLFVVDYLQLLNAPRFMKNTEPRYVVSYNIKELQALTQETGVPGIIISSINRAAVKGSSSQRPTMTDMKESGDIEYCSDLLLLIYREHVQNKKADPNKAEIIIGKQRNGPATTVHTGWIGNRTRFVNREFDRDHDASADESESVSERRFNDRRRREGGFSAPGGDAE